MHLLTISAIMASALISPSIAQVQNTTSACPSVYYTAGNFSCAYVTTVPASQYIGGLVPSNSSTVVTLVHTSGHTATLATIETTLGLTLPFFYTSPTTSMPAPTNIITGTLTCPSGYGTLNGLQCIATTAVATLPGSSSTMMTTVTPSVTVAPGSGGVVVTSAAVVSQISDGQVQATSTPAVAPYKGAASSGKMQAGGIIGLVGAFAVGLGLVL